MEQLEFTIFEFQFVFKPGRLFISILVWTTEWRVCEFVKYVWVLYFSIYTITEGFQTINQMHYEHTVNLILFFRKKLSSPKLNIIQWHGWTGPVGLCFQNCQILKTMCILGVYGYTLVIHSEMSVSVSAFVGKLNIAHFKKHFYFRKIGPQKQKAHHLYWNPDYESTHVCIEDEIKKKHI